MKKNWIFNNKYYLFIILFLIFIIPIFINEAYKVNKGYITVWGGADVLSFYGDILSFGGTVLLGALALWQNLKFKKENDLSQVRLDQLNTKANDINDRLLKIEENKQRPYIDFENGLLTDTTFIELYHEKNNEITIRVYLKNISNAVAKRCDLIEGELFLTNKYYKLTGKENASEIFDRRSILPNEKLYYHFQCEEMINENKINEMNNFFENNSPSIINGKADTEGMYIIRLKLRIVDLVDNVYNQKIWCFFKQNYSNKDKYNIYNRILEIE